MSQSKGLLPYFLGFCFVVYPLQFAWQGLDFCDEGNALAIYQQIFTHPESVADTLGTWGTSVIGGLWLAVFGHLGVLGTRVGGILVSLLTMIFVYLLYRDHIERKRLLWGLAGSFLFCYHFGNLLGFHYYGMSILFYAMSLFFLAEGLKKNSGALLGVAGFLISFNVFVRLPNALGLLFVLALPYNAYLKKAGKAALPLQSCWFFSGMLLNLMAVASALALLGHLPHYIQALRFLMESATRSGGIYKQEVLLGRILHDYFHLFRKTLLVTALLVLFVFLLGAAQKKSPRLATAGAGCLLAPIALSGFWGRPLFSTAMNFLFGACILTLGLRGLKPGPDKDLGLISLLVFALFLIMPFGTATYYPAYLIYVLMVALPLFFHFIHETSALEAGVTLHWGGRTRRAGFMLDEVAFAKAKRISFLVFVVFGFTNNVSYIHNEFHSRTQMTARINHPLLRGIRVNQEVAEPLNQLIEQLPRYVRPGDPMLVAWAAPILYYISGTYPYVPYPWTEAYLEGRLRAFLLEGPARGPLPVVIRERWNSGGKHPYDEILEAFFEKYGYTKKWENRCHEIYTPSPGRWTQGS